jgi:hypothetical protein
MTEKSLFWNGISIGDADAYATGSGYPLSDANYVSPTHDIFFRAVLNGTGNRGVLKGWGNELAVTGIATPISIATGGAVVYGLFYENMAILTGPGNPVAIIPSPIVDTRIDRIVVRRNWATQTARVTRIAGVEGGAAPAITQSPKPSGSGIYDIPLCSLSVTTGGVITITDERQYCLLPSTYLPNSFGTASLVNDSVVWADRATRTKILFLGGSDLQPNVNAGHFQYDNAQVLTQVGPPTWGGAANEKAWRTTGASWNYRGLYTTFAIPADYASGAMTSYVWWVNNAVVAPVFSIATTFQVWPNSGLTPAYGMGGNLTTTAVALSGAVGDVFRTVGASISGSCTPLYGGSKPCLDPYSIVHYFVSFYNTAGAEDINILGIEFNYAGYT